jgi:hypothetical protein
MNTNKKTKFKFNKKKKHTRNKKYIPDYIPKHTILKYDNTYIIVKPYFSNEDTINFKYLETILKKYNLSSNKYIDDIIKEDYKILNEKHITDSFYITKNKLKPINKNNLYPSLIWFSNKFINLNSRYYEIKTLVSNFLNKDKIDIIENKNKLYISFNNYDINSASKYLPTTFNITEIKKYKFGTKDEDKTYYILKPIDSHKGYDIIHVSSLEDVEQAIKYYKTHSNYKNVVYGHNVVAQEYIIKPLLFYKSKSNDKSNTRDTLGYKCHFRVNFIISYINKKIKSFILDDINICTAEEPYSTDIPFRKEVHDSHFKSTGGDFFLNENYEQLHITITQRDYIISEFNKIAKILENIMKRDTSEWLHPEHQNAFEILGIDFMVEDNRLLNHNLEVKLIEVNTVPGFGFNDTQIKNKILNLLFEKLDKHVFSKLF